jgi:hypothetical protein
MTIQLIQNQKLIDSFVHIMLNQETIAQPITTSAPINGMEMNTSEIPQEIKNKLPEIFNLHIGLDDKYQKLYQGDKSSYNHNSSDADMALVGHLSRKGLNKAEIDKVIRSSGLFRPKWDEKRGDYTYGELTINKAFEQTILPEKSILKVNHTGRKILGELNNHKPVFIANGMPPRRFAGPKIAENIRLFPENALSTLVALGAMGKTSFLMSIACHIASGKDWNNYPTEQKKVAMFFCEEDKMEVNRKFNAVTSSWTNLERTKAQENLLLVSLLGVDARLTSIERGHYYGTEITDEIIALLHEFELSNGIVIIDHMQGFTAGDLNISETATAIVREANKIVTATKSAVVLAAHIGKNNIKATEFEQGFAVGSLAFENGTRQMSGLMPMTEEQAKKFKLENTRKEYAWLSLAKNSYGGLSEGLWLRRVINHNYHTVVMEPIELQVPSTPERLSEIQKIGIRICEHIHKHPFTTKSQLEKVSGSQNFLKASKNKVRDALHQLINDGDIELHQVTNIDRQNNSIPKQVQEVLRLSIFKTASMQAIFDTGRK